MHTALLMLLAVGCDGGEADPTDTGEAVDSGAVDTDDTEADPNLVTPAEGGTVTSDDGRFTLSIPPGAVDSEQRITITPVGSPPEYFERLAGYTGFYKVEPELTFLEPVWFSIRASASSLTQPSNGAWLWGAVNSDASGNTVEFVSLNIKTESGDEATYYGETSRLQLHGLIPMAELLATTMCDPLEVGETCWDNELYERSLVGEPISVGNYQYQGRGKVDLDEGADGYVHLGWSTFYPAGSIARYLDYECTGVGTGTAVVEAGFGPYNGPQTAAFDDALWFPTALEIPVTCVEASGE